jgi:methylated-DNA-[protein]-cysteine S-methyltransferase
MKHSISGLPIVAQADIHTPLGPMTALATDQGLAVLWFDLQARDEEHAEMLNPVPVKPRHPHLAATRRWLDAYWARRAGDAAPAEKITLDLRGTLFQQAVWRVLQTIPHGQTFTYGQVAAAVGNGAVPRATGTACGSNPVAMIVPCHRVIGANGSLTGFAGGLPRKEKLLQHEGSLLL